MSKVIFEFLGKEVIIPNTKAEKMKDICQKYADKIDRNINSLIFLYEGKQLNFNLSFNEQANIIDKERNIMKILVYKYEDKNEYICPKCGEKIKFNIKDDIILPINNIKDVINGIKLNIDNIIRTSLNNSINIQLKNINIIINTLNDDIKKINEKMNDLLNHNNNHNNIIKNVNKNNYIISEIMIKKRDIDKKIKIINSYEESSRIDPNNWGINQKNNNEDEIKNCEIKIFDELIPFNYFYKFKSKGKYTIKYSFNNNITNTGYMFMECAKLTKINLSNFNATNVTNMRCMFAYCSGLTDINLYNLNTSNVTDMSCMFNGCSGLENIDLSNFNTNNATDMSGMFFKCSGLTYIDLFNFNTSNVINMSLMFSNCSGLTNINLSNFNTNNVTDMSYMFSNCSGLENINLSNFNTINVKDMKSMFENCKKLTKNNIITKDKKLLNNISI